MTAQLLAFLLQILATVLAGLIVVFFGKSWIEPAVVQSQENWLQRIF